MSHQRWDKQKVADYILTEYEKRGNDLRSNHVPSRIRQLAIDYWGGWRNALEALNIQIECKNNQCIKIEEKDGTTKVEVPKKNVQSLCWKCFRPLAPTEYYCPWHDHLELPKGVKYCTKDLSFSEIRREVAIIIDCPLFIQETPEDRKRVRKRNIEKLEKELLGKQGGYYKVSLDRQHRGQRND